MRDLVSALRRRWCLWFHGIQNHTVTRAGYTFIDVTCSRCGCRHQLTWEAYVGDE